MKNIAIFAEGGGNSFHQERELRRGFDVFLQSQKETARAKRIRWRLALSGGRRQTYDAFLNEIRQVDKETLVVLLVDSEGAIPGEIDNKDQNAVNRRNHLTERDGWDLKSVSPHQIHLMVQCMEAWIVSDPEALAAFYGKNFHQNKLPVRINLEEEPKDAIYDKLAQATRDTQKGEYGKIKHASKLLALIDSAKVAAKCPRFKTFTTWLTAQIEAC